MADLGVMLHGLRLRGESHAADLIEALIAETDWEYMVLSPQTNDFGDELMVPVYVDPERYRGQAPLRRRRKAGPWEVVPDV